VRSLPKYVRTGAMILVAALIAAQAIRINKTNPPAQADLSADPAVKSLIKRACYNCHSNETVWPWYSNVAPVSWLIGSDVNEGRRKVNFSEWGNCSTDIQNSRLREIAEELEEGGMPPWYYSIMHRVSRLSPEERRQITNWTFEKLGSSK
jgi:hypothetical protein